MLEEEHIDCKREKQMIRKRVGEQGENEKAVRIPHCVFMWIIQALVRLFIFIWSFGIATFAPSFQHSSISTKQQAFEDAAQEGRKEAGWDRILSAGLSQPVPDLWISPKAVSDFMSQVAPQSGRDTSCVCLSGIWKVIARGGLKWDWRSAVLSRSDQPEWPKSGDGRPAAPVERRPGPQPHSEESLPGCFH